MSAQDREYYNEERRAYPVYEAYRLGWAAVVELAERCRKELGEPPITYILRPRDLGFHRAHRRRREIEFTGDVSPLDVIHEVAHMVTLDHDADHAFVVAWLANMIHDTYNVPPTPTLP